MKYANATSARELKPLTSLRFFAAMMIVALHVTQFASTFWTAWIPSSSIHGVSFFFVLSGFILTHVYKNDRDLSIGRFMSLRIARIYPTALASMLLVFVAAPWSDIVRPGTGPEMRVIALALKLLMLDSLVPITNVYFAGNSPSWSISTEMFFYLSFPFLLGNLRSNWLKKLLFAGFCAAAIYAIGFLVGLPAELAADNRITLISLGYANPLVRGFEFVMGMATYSIWSRWIEPRELTRGDWTRIEFACLIVIAIWLTVDVDKIYSILPPPASLWFGTSGSCFAFAGLIGIFASGRGWLGELLTRRPIVWLGEISFAVYMYHQVVLRALGPALLPTFGAEISILLAFATIGAVAAANHRWVEPWGRTLMLRVFDRLRARPRIALADL